MSKTKEISSRHISKVKTRNNYGGIVKAKHMISLVGGSIQSKPLGFVDKKKSGFEATPLPSKCMPKNTSTPWTITEQNKINGRDCFNRFGSSACRTPLSPILFDKENMRFGENQNSVPHRKMPQVEKEHNEGMAKEIEGRRRTSGMRRLFSVVEHKDEDTDRQVKAQLQRTPLKSNKLGKENNRTKMVSENATDIQSHRLEENSLVRNLRNDWTSSVLCESLLKTPQISSSENVPGKQPRVKVRRHLSPLFEGTAEQQSKDKKTSGDENYSSSEEFEKEDDKRNSYSKRAPTWRSLHNKVMDSKSTSSLNVSVRRSRRMSAFVDVRPFADEENMLQNNVPRLNGDLTNIANEIDKSSMKNDCVLVKSGKPSVIEKAGVQAESCQTNVRDKFPRVKLRRLRLYSVQLQPMLKGAGAKTKVCDDSSSAAIIEKPSDENGHHVKEPQSNVICGKTSVDVHLPKAPDENGSSTFATTGRAQHCTNPNHPSGVKLPRLKLRRFKVHLEPQAHERKPATGTSKIAEVKDRTHINEQLPAGLKALERIDSLDDVSLTNPEAGLNTEEDVERFASKLQKVDHCKTNVNVLAGKQSPKVRLRGRPRKAKKPKIADVENKSVTKGLPIEDQELQDHQAANTDPIRNQEPETDTENIFDEDFAIPLCPASRSNSIERVPRSPVYDDVDNNLSVDTNCTRRKIFTSRIRGDTVGQVPIEKPKTKTSIKKKDKDDNIYDYFSQSSSEEMIPVDDIIKEMVRTGKAVVVKQKKRRGRPKGTTKAKKDVIKAKRLKTTNQPPQKQPAVPAVVLEDRDEPLSGGDFPSDSAPPAKRPQEQSIFSGLARSTMIKQAQASGKTPKRKMITDREMLLSMAKKIVGQSTPVRPTSEIPNVTQLSPIYGDKSPWRMTDGNLPTTFYFGRNTGNLPSFSSDHIPQTQTEDRPKSVSSFSSNDSDMENIAPPGVPENAQFDTRSIPARGPSNRSPLKSINIIDVVNLPPLVFDNTAKGIDKENHRSISSPVDKTASHCNQSVQSVNETEKTMHEQAGAGKVDLFGFEDIIDGTDSPEPSFNITAIPKVDLKEKLHRLKRLKPEVPYVRAARPEPIKGVYDGPKMRQKSLRQMLCSTMIERAKSHAQDTSREEHNDVLNEESNADLSNLFKDPDPETTFNQSDSRRTYSRLYKTKRRKVRNNFVMFMDSDASEEEDEPALASRPKKRHKNEPKINGKELDKFANEFNEMYKEVSQYQLIVE